MISTLIMLGLLMLPYFIVRLLATQITIPAEVVRWFGVLGIGMLFLAAALGHFFKTEEFAKLIPTAIPSPVQLVYVTGFIEGFISLAISFVHPAVRRSLGWILVGMLILFLPVNIWAASHHIPVGEHAWGLSYLLIRVPLQFIIIAWIYYFTCRPRLATLQEN